jgi:hypothetical protein
MRLHARLDAGPCGIIQMTLANREKGIFAPSSEPVLTSTMRISPGTFGVTRLLAAMVLAQASTGFAQEALFERPPIKYSRTPARDAASRMLAEIEAGRLVLPTDSPRHTLREVLRILQVPEWSQVLVFSKTSEQIGLIHPGNPRAVYFSDDVYVGYVPGGLIEIAASDPVLGMVFHTLDPRAAPARPVRDDSCLSCHASARTERIPGVLVRSIFPDADGRPLGAAGSFDTTDASPLSERWGGWYVTGRHGTARHMGNVTAQGDEAEPTLDREAGANLRSLSGKFPAGLHLRDDSDIVALLVLEHQCRMHNRIHQAAQDTLRAQWTHEQLHPGTPPDGPDTAVTATLARTTGALVRGFLFSDEADLGEDIEGEGEFARRFEEAGPKDSNGRSLRELRLHHRLFKYRCSYMIHSPSFAAAPPALRKATLQRLARALSDFSPASLADHLPERERQQLTALLAATIPDWPKD